jgi:hypothetical protein
MTNKDVDLIIIQYGFRSPKLWTINALVPAVFFYGAVNGYADMF